MPKYKLITALVFAVTPFPIADSIRSSSTSSNLQFLEPGGGLSHVKEEHAVPRFLLKLYRQRHYPARKNSRNTITAFFLEGGVRQILPMRAFELMFDLRSITSKNLVKAELRVLKKRATGIEQLRCEYSVMVHSFVNGTNSTKTLVDSLTAKNSLKGQWLEFNVTAALKTITQNSERMLGFRLSVDGALCAEFHIGKKGRHRPFLVTYTRDPEDKSSQTILGRIEPETKRAKPFLMFRTNTTVIDRQRRAIEGIHCRRRRFRVRFRVLKWNQWIITPRSYWANYCEGTCPRVPVYPLDVSNHAILQNILQYHSSYSYVPSPSCVPTELHSLSVLYRNREDNAIILKAFPGMTVSACGCR